jgi:predicted RNase H-like HicB family nuclease
MSVEAYLDRPYHIRLQHRDDGDGPYWFATVEELPGCMSDGDTEAEALVAVRDAMHGWLSAALGDGRPIPEPRDDGRSEYSGQFRVRLPSGLHATLADEARREGVSLNHFVSSALSAAVGWRRPPETDR